MPFGQLFTSLATVRETIGNPMREGIVFSDGPYNGTSLINLFNWTFSIATELNGKEINKLEEELNDVESTTDHYNSSTPNYPDYNDAETLSIMWYLASFGTLVMFFLLISFSEVCCKKSMTLPAEEEPEVSPPPYDLFAPPTYDSLYEGKKGGEKSKRKKKRKCEVFVINVLGDKDVPRATPSENVQAAENREQR